MSGLPQQLEEALRGIIPQLLDAINNNNFEQLGADAKQRVYAAVAKALLGNDHQTVAAALLNALRDDNITGPDWIAILKAWAEELVGSNPLAQDILDALDDNELSQDEVVSILLNWVRREIHDRHILAVIDGITTAFHVQDARAALEEYLAGAGIPNAISQGIVQVIAGGTITVQQIFQMLAAWAAASGAEDFARIFEQLPDAAPEDIILAVVGDHLPSDVETILKELLESDWSGLIVTVLGTLNLGLGQQVLADLAGGRFRDAAIEKITALLIHAGVQEEHAGPLLDAVIGLATGARSLFASGPEPDAPFLETPAMIALWREIRSVIYMAQLFCKGGELIPTQPQAQPHIFLAAKIRFDTLLQDLVPSNASKGERNEFSTTLTTFLDVHFGDRMKRRFMDNQVSVIADDELLPASNATCKHIYVAVDDRLKPSTGSTSAGPRGAKP